MKTSTINNNPPPYLSVVLPAYNDVEALQNFLPDVIDFCHELGHRTEVIIVDDGSEDELVSMVNDFMLAIKQATASQDDWQVELQLLKLSRNFGKEPALSAGIAHSKGELVALMDADGQHPLAVLSQMLEMVNEQSQIDMVAAVQANRPNENKLARTLKAGFYHFIQDSRRYHIRPNAGDFRLMNRKVVNALLSLPERQRFMKGLYAWVGFNTVYLPFTADVRQAGDSKFNYKGLFELAMVGITSFSQKPLRWISRMGMIVSILAILYGIFIVFEKIFIGNSVDGWATVAAGIMFSAGLQLICLGVIGEYVGRLYEEIKQRPLYLVDEHLSSMDLLEQNLLETDLLEAERQTQQLKQQQQLTAHSNIATDTSAIMTEDSKKGIKKGTKEETKEATEQKLSQLDFEFEIEMNNR